MCMYVWEILVAVSYTELLMAEFEDGCVLLRCLTTERVCVSRAGRVCVQDVGVSLYDGCRCVSLFCVLLFAVCVWRGCARARGCM